MTTTEIEQAILDIFRKRYKMEYTSKLKVKELPEGGYSATFAMNNIDKPLVISAQLEGEKFLKYMEQELLSKSLWTVEYFLGYQTLPEFCTETPEQKKCNNERY